MEGKQQVFPFLEKVLSWRKNKEFEDCEPHIKNAVWIKSLLYKPQLMCTSEVILNITFDMKIITR